MFLSRRVFDQHMQHSALGPRHHKAKQKKLTWIIFQGIGGKCSSFVILSTLYFYTTFDCVYLDTHFNDKQEEFPTFHKQDCS